MSKDNQFKLSKKHLLDYEYQKYKSIGEPNLEQNWLEIFTPAMVEDLFTIMDSCSDNQQKAEYIEKELSYYGFEKVGLGTNIFAMHNPAYPGVVFKFALDPCGLADNFNDGLLEELVNDFLGKPRYNHTYARHPSGIVSVQERKVLVSSQVRMDSFRSSILKTLTKLSEKFLIVDLSPMLYQFNYGIDRNGDWCFVDASDLYPIENLKGKIRCHKAIGWDDDKEKTIYCGGRLRYNGDFSNIVCTKCGMEFIPSEIRPDDKEEVGKKMMRSMLDGYDVDAREDMRSEEIEAILGTMHREDQEDTKDFKRFTKAEMDAFRKPGMVFQPVMESEEEEEDGEEPETEVREEVPAEPDPVIEEKEPEPVEETPKPVVKPPVNNGFTELRPRRQKIAIMAAPDSDVQRPTISAPDPVIVQSVKSGFIPLLPNLRPVEDAEEGSVTEVTIKEPEGLRVKEAEIEDNEPPIAYYPCPHINYKIIDKENGGPGILLDVVGDFTEAYENSGLPVYLSVDGGVTMSMAFSAESMRKPLKMTYDDLLDELDELDP